jgi:hypothetical protein
MVKAQGGKGAGSARAAAPEQVVTSAGKRYRHLAPIRGCGHERRADSSSTLMRETMTPTRRLTRLMTVAVLALLVVTAGNQAAAQQASEPRRFASPEEAIQALVGALRSGSLNALVAVLGPDARPLAFTADFMADRARMEAFVREFETAHRLEYVDPSKVILRVGREDRPMPIPIVRSKNAWSFDTRTGKDELLGRRIADNEQRALELCATYVDAQREYHREPRDGSGALQYAQRIRSNPGLRDGLYWDPAQGVPPSPLDAVVARAGIEGYKRRGAGAGPSSFHGYYFRVLTSQGPDAPGGALDYVVNRRMTRGFAMVAFPAEYGVTGTKTFIVNQEGTVYQRDLGPRTTTLGREMKSFNPDRTWTPVPAAGGGR